MGQEHNLKTLRSDQNFRPDARVWRMSLGTGVGKELFFGRFDSPTGQSEVNHPNVLADRLPPVWTEHLPLQYEALSGNGDLCLTIEEPIDPTLLKPIDQMTIEELKKRGLTGISVDTGLQYLQVLPTGETNPVRIKRLYPANAITKIDFRPDSFTLTYTTVEKTVLSATYSNRLATMTALTNSQITPDMYPPPQEPSY